MGCYIRPDAPQSYREVLLFSIGTFYELQECSYYNAVRIEKAQQLLLRGVAVKEASAQVGYNNLNYFYRIFKAQTGMTPKEYLSGEQAKSAARFEGKHGLDCSLVNDVRPKRATEFGAELH